MDDISREVPPDDTGASPVSERQKGPEELVRFERGHIDEDLVVDRRLQEHQLREALGGVELHTPERLMHGLEVDVNAPTEGDGGLDGDGPRDPEQPDGEHAEAATPVDEAEGDVTEQVEEGHAEEEHAEPVELEAQESEAEPQDADEADIDPEAAKAAVQQESEVAEIEESIEEGEDGLPGVPELADTSEVAKTVFVLMLTSRDGLSILRLAQACNTSQKLVEEALEQLQQQLRDLDLPVELTRVGDTVRWMSSAAAFPYLQRLRGVRKLEKLSPAALETLAVIAYRQPVMRSEIEAIRGVKAGPMLRTLLQHKLVKVTGRADVPGRPLQYGTTPHFLERFGIASLDDLPSVKEWKNLG